MELPGRYEDIGPIATGGMAEVRRVRDRRLRAEVAMKICLPAVAADARLQRRFEDEARLTAQLHHPGVIAVHDLGLLPDGRPFFTMELVRGRTLQDVLLEHHNGGSLPGGEDGLVGLVRRIWRAADAVGHAHSRELIHRDLKPENIMVGAFGTVRVMDWGLARLLTEDDALAGVSLGPRDGAVTQLGEVVGTPAFMAPEQARGRLDALGPEADVYSLGATLYTVLAGRPPYAGDGASAWRALVAGTPPPPLAEALPAGLRRICAKAMAADPLARHADAEDLAHDLGAWIQGADRRQRAARLVARADGRAAALATQRAEAAALRAAAAEVLAPLRSFDPVARKAPAWEMEDRAAALERDIAVAEAEWVQDLRAALRLVPEDPAAHGRLAAHRMARVQAAERRGEAAEVAQQMTHLAQHAAVVGGAAAAFVEGLCGLSLHSQPPGAHARIFRCEVRQRRRVEVLVAEHGPTPVVGLRLPHGSYVVELSLAGRETVRLALLLERGADATPRRPGAAAPHPTWLPPLGLVDPDECIVPAGCFQAGGDPEAADSLPAQRVWLDAFAVARHPVTNRDYLAWLNRRLAAGDREGALAACPRTSRTADYQRVYALGPDGRLGIGVDHAGRRWALDAPVVGICWADAAAYAADHGRRLPHALEWEKAARGADGRFFAWGDHCEPTWANMGGSVAAGTAAPQPVGRHPVDRSVYGVEGTAGNVRDWCRNPWRRQGPTLRDGLLVEDTDPDPAYRASRGGAWSAVPAYCRAAMRFAGRPGDRFMSLGMRLVRPLGP